MLHQLHQTLQDERVVEEAEDCKMAEKKEKMKVFYLL
jgi:hypothetical protein